MSPLLWLCASAVLAALVAVVLAGARRRFGAGEDLPARLSAAIWAAWTLHAVLVGAAAATRTWDLGLGGAGVVAGGALALAGAVLYVGGLGAFGSVGRISGTRSDALVTGGVYRVSRHPQYVGWALVLAGAALLGSSGLALLYVGLLVAVLAVYLPVEERALELQHGEAYARYRREAPRLLGPPR